LGLAPAIGCAAAGKTTGGTGSAGSGSPGSAGSASPGSAGSAGPGTGGTTGAGGSAGSGGSGGSGGNGGSSSLGSGGSASPGSGGSSNVGSAGSSGAAGDGAGGSSSVGAGGTSSGSGGTSPAGTGGTGGICQTADFKFTPKIPTAYLVVDRSGSMFHCLSTSQPVCSTKSDSSWSKLKDAIEGVIAMLDSQVRFGFTTIYGTNPNSGGSCPVLNGTLSDNVPPALNNAAAIKTLYDGLAWPAEADSSTPGKKLESPASEALAAAAKALTADTTPGDKYMIFITDGQEDYCDDSLDICASDSTVWRLQNAFAANIKTIVFGLQTSQFNLPAGVLQAFANAGAGEATVAPLHGTGAITDLYYQCNGGGANGGLWPMDLVTAGKTAAAGVSLGTYSATAGPTMPYQPNAADATQLATQLAAALSGVKSCTFDLSDVGGKAIKVDTSKLSQAHVLIEGSEIPLSATNGWNVDMSAPTTLVLSGTACTTWRMPDNNDISFNFPCSSIIFE
jgi:hypothetical protein